MADDHPNIVDTGADKAHVAHTGRAKDEHKLNQFHEKYFHHEDGKYAIYSAENPVEEWMMTGRNIAVCIAAVLFALAMLGAAGALKDLFMGIAYFLGAGAYVLEILILTDCFETKTKLKDMLMPYVFGALYVALGISYIV
ncbi:MAG: hypothetical protein Q4B99_01105 [Clostridia bacterium]|nr:hypothetical protein [Clostridia bacterium]